MRWGHFACVLCLALFIGGCNATMKANGAFKDKNYAEAATLYEQARAEDPAGFGCQDKLGYAYLMSGENAKALAELKKAAEADPDNQLAKLYLGLAYLKNDMLSEALAAWKGFSYPEKPEAEAEVKRLTTLLQVAESKRLAKRALAGEAAMGAESGHNCFAVFEFAALTDDPDAAAMRKAMADMVITDLSRIQSIRVLERCRIQALMNEMRLGESGVVDAASAPRMGMLLGAENLVVGNLASMQPELNVNASTASATNRQVMNSFSVGAARERFFELQKEIVFNIVKSNGIALTPQEQQILSEYHTKNLQAFLYYGKGLEALDNGQWQKAKDLFDMAVQADPLFKFATDRGDASPAGLGISSADVEGVAQGQPQAVNAIAAKMAAAIDATAQGASQGGGAGGYDPGAGAGH